MIRVDFDNIIIQDANVSVLESVPKPVVEPLFEPKPKLVVAPSSEPELEEDLKEDFPPYMKVYSDVSNVESLQTVNNDYSIKMKIVVPLTSTPPKPLPPPPPRQQNRPTGFRMKMRF